MPDASTSIALREDAGPVVAAVRPGSEQNNDGSIFSARDLVQAQMSAVASLEKARLACKHRHPTIAVKISEIIHDGATLSTQTLGVFENYAKVAKDVKNQFLPDVALAVQEAEPQLAIAMLENVNKWLEDMQKDADKTAIFSLELADKLKSAISQAQEEKLITIDPPAVPAKTPVHESTARNLKNIPTRELLDGLVAIESKMTSTESVVYNNWKPEYVDLLFLAPGFGSSSVPILAEADKDVVMTEDVAESGGGAQCSPHQDFTTLRLCPAANMPTDLVRAAKQFAATHPLLIALRELRMVSEIFSTNIAFWQNTSSIVQRLSRFKDNTSALVMYSGRNQALKQRFDQRLTEYAQLWDQLARTCIEYCDERKTGLGQIRQFVNQVENVADTVDRKASLRLRNLLCGRTAINLNFKIYGSGGKTFALDLEPSITVQELKALASTHCDIEPGQIKVIFKGRILKDSDVIEQLQVASGSAMHIVKSAHRASAAGARTAATPAAVPAATTPASAPLPSNPTAEASAMAPMGVSPDLGSMMGDPAMMQVAMQMMGGSPGADANFAGPLSLPSIGGAGTDLAIMSQMLQNPVVQSMMLQQMIQSNAMLQNMAQQSPMLQQVLNNPQMLQAMLKPQVKQAMLNMQQTMAGMGAPGAMTQTPAATGIPSPATDGAATAGADAFSNPMFDPAMMQALMGRDMGGGFEGGVPGPADTMPAEERFAVQLDQLSNMGFPDKHSNIQALQTAHGDVNQAINSLLGA